MSGKTTAKTAVAMLLCLLVSIAPVRAGGPHHGGSFHGGYPHGHYGHGYYHASLGFWWGSACFAAAAFAPYLLFSPAEVVVAPGYYPAVTAVPAPVWAPAVMTAVPVTPVYVPVPQPVFSGAQPAVIVQNSPLLSAPVILPIKTREQIAQAVLLKDERAAAGAFQRPGGKESLGLP